MSFHRTMLVAVAALTATGVTSGAFACGIYGCGGPYAVTFTPPAAVYAAPVVYGLVPSYQVVPLFQAPVVYQPPLVYQAPVQYQAPVVEYTPLVPQPIGVAAWDTGGAGAYAAPGVEVAPEAYAGEQPYYGGEQPYYGGEQPYVVNQGPDYRGPGLMVPYRTWSPRTGLAAPHVYPYVGHRYGGHPYMGHPYAGHPYARHAYAGHPNAGHPYAGHPAYHAAPAVWHGNAVAHPH